MKHALFAALCLALLAPAACSGAERCPDGDGVIVAYDQSAPSSVSARCSSDTPDIERRRLEADGPGTFEVLCPPGQVPGPQPGTSSAETCDGTPCTRSTLTCVDSPRETRSMSSPVAHLAMVAPGQTSMSMHRKPYTPADAVWLAQPMTARVAPPDRGPGRSSAPVQFANAPRSARGDR